MRPQRTHAAVPDAFVIGGTERMTAASLQGAGSRVLHANARTQALLGPHTDTLSLLLQQQKTAGNRTSCCEIMHMPLVGGVGGCAGHELSHADHAGARVLHQDLPLGGVRRAIPAIHRPTFCRERLDRARGTHPPTRVRAKTATGNRMLEQKTNIARCLGCLWGMGCRAVATKRFYSVISASIRGREGVAPGST